MMGGELEFDEILEESLVAADVGAAVDEDRGGALDAERVAFSAIDLDGFFGSVGGETGFERCGIEAGVGSEADELVPCILGRDDVLIVEDRVVDSPKSTRRLHVGTAGADGGGFGPRMNVREGIVFEDEADLWIGRLDGLEICVKLAAVRAFEVAVFDDYDFGIGRAAGGIVVEMDLGAIVGEGILRGAVHVAAKDGFAVLADVDGAGVGLAVDSDANWDGEEVGGSGGLKRAEIDFGVRAPGEEVAEKRFGGFEDGGLIGRSSGGRRSGLRLAKWRGEERGRKDEQSWATHDASEEIRTD